LNHHQANLALNLNELLSIRELRKGITSIKIKQESEEVNRLKVLIIP